MTEGGTVERAPIMMKERLERETVGKRGGGGAMRMRESEIERGCVRERGGVKKWGGG